MPGPNAAESYVQVAPDSTGKQISNLVTQVLDGVTPGQVDTVYIQETTLDDENGQPLRLQNYQQLQIKLLVSIRDELRAIKALIGRDAGEFAGFPEAVQPGEENT